MQKGEKVIVNLKITRKAFIPEYVCGTILFSFVFLFGLNLVNVPKIISYFIGGFAFFSFTSAEFSRFMLRYRITSSKMVVIHGIIKQLKTNIYFHPLGFVPDINVKQGRIERILNYGTIFVKGGDGNSFELKDISSPHKIMDLIENLINKNKGVRSLGSPPQ